LHSDWLGVVVLQRLQHEHDDLLTLTTYADYIPEQETENPLPEPVAPTAPATNVVPLHRNS
jgi:hypothetical protein